MAPGRTLVIDPKNHTMYIGKQQIFVTVVSTKYPTIVNEFEVMIWVYNFCSQQQNGLPSLLKLPSAWYPTLVAVQGGDSQKYTFPEWTLQTDLDYFQDWGESYNFTCGERKFSIS